jgi:ribosomal protein L7/L12
MNKSLLAIACLTLPLAVLAASPKADVKHAAPVTAAAASAPAQAASPVDTRSAVRSAQQRGTKNAACRKEATDLGLSGQALKDAMMACMKQGQ